MNNRTSPKTNIMTSTERFSINSEGMRELHAGRKPVSLVKELIQNAFDEDITRCVVTIQYIPALELTRVVVKDDGPGFKDITHSHNFLAHTEKRGIPTKRGRWNSGEKEFISVTLEASIKTVGWTVEFPSEGGRVIRKNARKKGTVVEAFLPWSQDQAEELIEDLKKFRPVGYKYIVNGTLIQEREPIVVHTTTLPTVLQSEPGAPMRPTRRKTALHILEPLNPKRGIIYEMGIPVEEINLPVDVDVMQKIPLSPNREALPRAYLQDIYCEVLNAIYDRMTPEDFAESWVKMAIEDPNVMPEAVKATIANRYGEKTVIQSTDKDSNLQAIDHGYEVINPRALSSKERENMRNLGELQSAKDVFGRKDKSPKAINVSADEVKKDFALWVKELGKKAGLRVTVRFIYAESSIAADCSSNTANPRVRFNTYHLSNKWFGERGPEQIEFVIHEFGHAVMNGEMSHGPIWGDSCARVGAAIVHDSMGGY